MKLRQFLLALLLLLGMALPAAAAEPAKEMTLMVYLCGSNLESNAGAATKDLTEMLRSGFDPDQVNIVVLAGGSERWFCGFAPRSSSIYTLGNARPKLVFRDALHNMGDPDTLSFFLRYARENYPAKRYGLILWDHGSGPIGGVCADTLFSGDALSLPELQTALEQAGLAKDRLAFIGFDACLMATLETALAVAPYADYMIASQETEPGDGWDYRFLKNIHKYGGREIGRQIVTRYTADAGETNGTKTLSCIDLSKVDRLENAVSQYFSAVARQLREDTFPEFVQKRSNARSFGSNVKPEQDYDLVDILSLAKQFSGQNAISFNQLQRAVRNAVTCSISSLTDCCGLSLYHPFRNEGLFQRKQPEFVASPYVPIGYKQYCGLFHDQQTGTQGAKDWDLLSTQSLYRPRSGCQRFTIRIPAQQQESFRSAQFLVLGNVPGQEEGWTLVYASPELEPVANGILSWTYYGEGLYAVADDTGQTLAGPIWDLRLDTGNSYYTVLRPESTAFLPESAVGEVLCRFRMDEETGWFIPQEALMYDDVLGVFTPRQSFSLADYPAVEFANPIFRPAWREDGAMLPPDSWEKLPSLAHGPEVQNPGWHLEYGTGAFPEMQLYGCFLLRDNLNQTTLTELSAVNLPLAS